MPKTPITDEQAEQVHAWEVNIGKLVREKRRALGMSQETLGALAHCDRQSINRLENASYTPSVDRLFWLALALRCQPTEFLPDIALPVTAPSQLPQRRLPQQRRRRTA